MSADFVTVIEHPNYLKKAARLLSELQMEDIVNRLAMNPLAGDVMAGTGGFRKFRYAGVPGKGKSGGLRIIHFFVAKDMEVHLIDIFAKSDTENLPKAQRNELAAIAVLLRGGRHE